MKFSFTASSVKVTEADRRRVAYAATAAVAQVGALIKAGMRSELATAGFSSRVQNAARVNVYPRTGLSPNAAAVASFNAKFASVYEEGATIAGHPLLWIALDNVPTGSTGRKLRPAEYAARLGKLVSLNVPGHPPMLAGRIGSSQVSRVTATSARLRRKALRTGTLQGKLVPLYVGVSSVSDPQLYNITGVIERGAAELPGTYERYFLEAGR